MRSIHCAYLLISMTLTMAQPALSIEKNFFQTPLNTQEMTIQGNDNIPFNSQLSAEYHLVFFGFTRCSAICPVVMSKLNGVYSNLKTPKKIKVILFSLDPTDTPKGVNQFAQQFNPDFIGVTGNIDQIEKATDLFSTLAWAESQSIIQHSGFVSLVDSEGQILQHISEEQIDELSHFINAL